MVCDAGDGAGIARPSVFVAVAMRRSFVEEKALHVDLGRWALADPDRPVEVFEKPASKVDSGAYPSPGISGGWRRTSASIVCRLELNI